MKKTYLFFNLLFIIFSFSCQKKGIDDSLIPVKKSECGYIFINNKGEEAFKVNEELYSATFFYNGLSLVEVYVDDESRHLQTRYAYINDKGKFITDKRYKDAAIFNENIAWCVEDNSYPMAIDTEGNILFTLKEAEKVRAFEDGLAAFSVTADGFTTCGYVDTKGNIAIAPDFVDASDFYNGLAPATMDTKAGYGYINKKGEFVISPQFSYAGSFNKNGNAIVSIGDYPNRKYGVINTKGKYVISPQYDAIVFDGDKMIVQSSKKYGWIDKNGNYTINPQFSSVSLFGNSSATGVSIDGEKYGLIDDKGTYIVNPQYDFAHSFIGDIAPFSMSGKVGFLDKKGKIVINPQYESISLDYIELSEGYNYRNLLTVTTDYCDIESICNAFIGESNQSDFRGVSSKTTFENIKNRYNDLSYASSDSRRFKGVIDLGNGVSITETIFKFPVELSNTSYNYYDGKYETIETNEAKIGAITYWLVIDSSSRAKDKGVKIAREIADAIKKKYQISQDVDDNGRIEFQSATMKFVVQGNQSSITMTVSFIE
ncbi:WG repeat protein [Dysgonomonas alginatilytica]|uniref:WG repeat protein n=1 Tax=Dysgonomonas alginatilytica TaxID=1605892 RepID=A0A2V3PJK4_9BACT|nr:WG repeat-containing protein [Dysgonomonas alginatilytica]PXV58473.1 WG repeat protein [Dysgonomonas alginatilytica]